MGVSDRSHLVVSLMNLSKRVDRLEARLDVRELVDDHTRDELNELASDAGVEDAEDLDNKAQVAEAIVAADGGS